jgi:hypothetical protein
MRTYTIELRADYQTDDKHDVLLEAVREAARTVLATAMMLKDKRDPQISMQVGDMFNKDAEVQLFNDDLQEKPSGE